ncbi:putative bifunctional diguanylate cyclase/phosphodiesterase [Curvibacter lanceolatus]|uniref:putative bifunctional diguanylate cyclase/phosphodiesterase n=1 Tax=Curvibacter lanceolatus TaxID=86182 RepID=UPI0030810E9B
MKPLSAATGHPALTRLHQSLWITVLMSLLFVGLFVYYVQAEKAIDQANEERLESLGLASELRQSSDDLTRMVRTYVATGDLVYQKYYMEILAIRDGHSPRPLDYRNVYWDLVLGDGPRPRAAGAAVPLLTLMEQAHFTQAEFAKLAEAKANSDALTGTELAAMVLIEASGGDVAARRLRAIAMLHDAAYHEAKARIMRPIAEFQEMVELRTTQAVREAAHFAVLVRWVFAGVGLLLGFTLWQTYRALRHTLGGKLEDIHRQIERLGRGDFDEPIPVEPALQHSVLGWLAETQRQLLAADTEHRRSAAQINNLAFFDQLTGLPNRVLLLDRLRQTQAISQRTGQYAALLFIDLDHFKTLNDTKGHDMGDLLLQQVADRLRQGVHPDDTVARIGGDEFVMVLGGLGETARDAASATEAIAERLLRSLTRAYTLRGFVHHSSASLGATLFLGQGTSMDELMKQADLAMYRAKDAGRQAVRFFDPAMEAVVKHRAEIEDDLRRALQQQQFVLHFQPQVNSASELLSAEVLVRWQHPERGLVPPGDFIGLAEDSGLIVPLGRWVLQAACEQLACWAGRPGLGQLSLAVNMSAKQFRDPGFVAMVLEVVQHTGADPRRLKLELTESLLVHDVDEIIATMQTLQGHGIGFSLDDFGTGYSSLTYLKRLPLNQLKIDQSFVRDMLDDAHDAAIAKTIVTLAQSLDLPVIAEGVETLAQQRFLQQIGCHAYQGYLFSRPVPLDVFEPLALAGTLQSVA